jgi:hypothetical protein
MRSRFVLSYICWLVITELKLHATNIMIVCCSFAKSMLTPWCTNYDVAVRVSIGYPSSSHILVVESPHHVLPSNGLSQPPKIHAGKTLDRSEGPPFFFVRTLQLILLTVCVFFKRPPYLLLVPYRRSWLQTEKDLVFVETTNPAAGYTPGTV